MMCCPYSISCNYTTKDPDGDGVFHLVISHHLTVVGAKLYEWEPMRDYLLTQEKEKKE